LCLWPPPLQPHHQMHIPVLALGACAVAHGAGADLAVTVDLTAPTVPFVHNWKECVGSGHMLLGTRADWRAHLKLARDELGFKRIRGHGLFDDDMSAVPNRDISPDKTMPYNVDQVFGFLVD
jgi:xylan 1,4-beta-xylosidase